MTNYYKDNNEALKVARNSTFIDSRIISRIFKHIKNKGILAETIKINMDPLKEIKQKPKKDFIDQITLYRDLRGYTKKQLAEELGISPQKMSNYEMRRVEMKNPKIIQGIINILNIENPNLTKYQRFLLENPNEKIKDYILENNEDLREISKILSIEPKTIMNWILNDDVIISEESYNKMKRNYNKIFHQGKQNYLEEDEEEEQE